MITKEAIEELSQGHAIRAASDAIAGRAGTPLPVALPSDFKLHDLEQFLPQRRRARGTMRTSSVADYAAYISAHKEPGATVFIGRESMAADAVLNLGEPDYPGHADNLAVLVSQATAAYKGLLGITSGRGLKQSEVAEFLEDWPDQIACFHDAAALAPAQAIAAVRKITIEGLSKIESQAKQLGVSRSAFESVQASSTETLPTHIHFKCAPFHELSERVFSMRLGVLTGTDKPALTLRVINSEKHSEEMAAELAERVRAALAKDVAVVVGSYSTGKL